MQIVIDVTEEELEHIKNTGVTIARAVWLFQKVANGVVLPEHGDLIDRDVLRKQHNHECVFECGVCSHSEGIGECECSLIDNASVLLAGTEE